LGLVFLFTLLLIFGFPILSMLPLILYHKSILSTLFYKAIMNNKQINSFSIIKETLKYYKITIVSIISILVVLLAFLKLGTIPGIFSIITIILIYFGFISINLFQSIPEKNLNELVSYEQASKICSNSGLKKIDKDSSLIGRFFRITIGFYVGIVEWFLSLFIEQKGGSISNELKKINKLYNK
jgi:hypothetical protein